MSARAGEAQVEKIRRKLGLLQRKRDQLTERLEASDDQLQVGMRVIENGLALLDNPEERYRRMDSAQRQMMNEAFFEKLYVYEDSRVQVMLRSPMGDMLEAQEIWREASATSVSRRTVRLRTRAWLSADNQMANDLAAILCDHGSNKALMVVLARHLSNSTPQPLSRAIAAYRKLDLSGRSGRRARTRALKRALRLNTSQVDRLIVSYQAGATVYELAHQFYIDRRTVSIHIKRRGVAFRHQPPSSEVIDTMVRLYASGLSLANVGKQVGMNASSVRAHLRARGVRSRDTHGRERS